MPRSLAAVYLHLVFSTKHRQPFLRDKKIRNESRRYVGGISKNLDCPSLIVGGVEDHVHLLCRFGRKIAIADWAKELKRVSNLWLKEKNRQFVHFQWQGRYAVFSKDAEDLEQIKHDIANQRGAPSNLEFSRRTSRIAPRALLGMGCAIRQGMNPKGIPSQCPRLALRLPWVYGIR
jgi:REP element-mobilizing transposase RayT